MKKYLILFYSVNSQCNNHNNAKHRLTIPPPPPSQTLCTRTLIIKAMYRNYYYLSFLLSFSITQTQTHTLSLTHTHWIVRSSTCAYVHRLSFNIIALSRQNVFLDITRTITSLLALLLFLILLIFGK